MISGSCFVVSYVIFAHSGSRVRHKHRASCFRKFARLYQSCPSYSCCPYSRCRRSRPTRTVHLDLARSNGWSSSTAEGGSCTQSLRHSRSVRIFLLHGAWFLIQGTKIGSFTAYPRGVCIGSQRSRRAVYQHDCDRTLQHCWRGRTH